MTRFHYAKFFGNVLCGSLVALSLGSFQVVAEAASFSKVATGIPHRSNGRTATFGEGPNSATPNTNVGNGSIGNTGWYRGGEAAAHPSNPASFMELGANGDVHVFPGTKYPFQAGYKIPASTVATVALGLVGGWPGIALTGLFASAPYIKQWFDDSGVGVASDGALSIRDPEGCYSDCYSYKVTVFGGSFDGTTGNSPGSLCNQGAAISGLDFVSLIKLSSGNYQCNLSMGASFFLEKDKPRRADDELPASMDDIAPYLMRTPFNPGIVDDIIQNGGEIPLPNPNITGPTSIPGKPVTSTTTGTQTVDGQQVPTRTETSTQTTYNFATNNNQVTNTTNNTTTTTNTYNQATGVLIGTTTATTETTPEEKDDRGECEKNPKQLNCADLDTPDGEIPKSKVNVTYSIEDSWGGGSCPADLYSNVAGQSMKVYDWQQTCGYVSTYVRPILLLLCAFGALLIVMPGRAES